VKKFVPFLILGLVLSGCGLFSSKKEEKKVEEKKPPERGTSDWDARIGGGNKPGEVSHADRIGAASIGTLAMGGPSTSPKVADFIADPSLQVRQKAVETLVGWGKDAEPALPKLFEHLRNVDAGIRAAAAETLARMGLKKAEKGLERAEKDKSPEVKVWGHAGLAKIEGDCEDHMEDIADILKSGKMQKPQAAADAMLLLNCASEDAISDLIDAFKSADDESQRAAAARAIGNIGPKAAAAVPALMGALGEKGFRIRVAALLALAKMGPKAAPAVALLAEILKDPAPRFRELAAHALGEIGPAARSAEGPLKKAANDPEGTVQAAAKRALHKIMGK
jgi:HEAT repeat protein